MGALNGRVLAVALVLAACSPEARRTRDGGPGADPGNKRLIAQDGPAPRAADTTLWPGRAPTPVERLARGEVPPPTYPAATIPPDTQGQSPVSPTVPPSTAQQRTYDRSTQGDARRQSGANR